MGLRDLDLLHLQAEVRSGPSSVQGEAPNWMGGAHPIWRCCLHLTENRYLTAARDHKEPCKGRRLSLELVRQHWPRKAER